MEFPPAEVRVDTTLVRDLLQDQHPDLADEPLLPLDEGWDNFTFRLGGSLAVRVPRRHVAVELIRNEQIWLPLLASRLPIPIPTPVRVGRSSERFPWPWSIVRWLTGTAADRESLDSDQAPRLATFLKELHRPAPVDAPVNPFRGCPLHDRSEVVEERLHRLCQQTGLATNVIHLWREALTATPANHRRWVHGDLHPRNVLVENGALTGIIDWGDLNGGDAATDIACNWMLFDSPKAWSEFLDTYQPSEALVARGRGWAIVLATALADSGEPRHVKVGHSTLQRLSAAATM